MSWRPAEAASISGVRSRSSRPLTGAPRRMCSNTEGVEPFSNDIRNSGFSAAAPRSRTGLLSTQELHAPSASPDPTLG